MATRFDTKWPAGEAPVSRLYKNNRDGTFTDVTVKSGVARTGWGQGVCAGDYDNDGFEDLYVNLLGRLRTLAQQRQRYFHRCSQDVRRDHQPGRWSIALEHRLRVCRLQQRWAAGPFVANYIDFDPKTTPLPEFRSLPLQRHPGSVRPARPKGRQEYSVPQQRR